MKIIYDSNSEEKTYTNEHKLIKKIGKPAAEEFFALINAIESAVTLSDVAPLKQYNLHPLVGDKKGTFSLSISKRYKYRVEFIPLDINSNEIKCSIDLNTFSKQYTT